MRTSLLILSLCTVALTAPAFAADQATNAAAKAELKTSFDSRTAQLAAAKATGSIGECTDGTVALVGDLVDANLSATIEAENADRKKLYQLLASETNASAAQIGERNAMRNYQNAKAGEWLRTRDGIWKKK